jgi:peptide-methionine (R)-S-oxide reductase
MSKRGFLGSLLAGAGWAATRSLGAPAHAAESGQSFPFKLTDEQWKARLSRDAYYVLRTHGTERPGTSPLNAEKRKGLFHCAGCEHPLFDATTKYESGTGWPSFYEPLKGAVGYTEDRSYLMVRTEVHCANCGGHLGHVFDDGPKPTGKRYCMNGVSLTFKPAIA